MIIVFAFVVLLVPVFVAMILAAVFGALMIFGRWCYGWKGEVLSGCLLVALVVWGSSLIEAWLLAAADGAEGAAGMAVAILHLMYWGTVALAALFLIGGRTSGFK